MFIRSDIEGKGTFYISCGAWNTWKHLIEIDTYMYMALDTLCWDIFACRQGVKQ